MKTNDLVRILISTILFLASLLFVNQMYYNDTNLNISPAELFVWFLFINLIIIWLSVLFVMWGVKVRYGNSWIDKNILGTVIGNHYYIFIPYLNITVLYSSILYLFIGLVDRFEKKRSA